MFFSKRVKKSFEVMQERNRRYLESMKEPDTGSPDAEGAEEEENLLSVSGEIPAGDPGIEAQAEREIEEEIREDDGTGENGGPVDELPGEGLETEGKQARRMRYAAVRDPAADEPGRNAGSDRDIQHLRPAGSGASPDPEQAVCRTASQLHPGGAGRRGDHAASRAGLARAQGRTVSGRTAGI